MYWRGDDTGMTYPRSYRQFVELAHLHLFIEPAAPLVVAHLYKAQRRHVGAQAGRSAP
ncbi:MAG: hypothetical protein FJ090_01745 [Deltaproteobacteria bacterium]|nr:hypothetical protein [Deltaproteobacteria bacterium]